ncbi:C-type lectin lectoxin-Phi1-like isoform X2 [Rhineura floridana]|uniref:C-type lectin lectoxin-Phi1-like isoform X2 n=1 Tax=Rhineura floridana TaxID=261503 RepID=UPI002AC8911B|nr:C-type lectin lectoxin-Phi1-like isoform X2 [Rhineura floridana]
MGVEMIRSFIIGLDSYYEDKDDFQILDAAQNLSEKMKDFADLNDEIKRVNVIIGNLQAGWMIYNRNLYLITRDKNTWWESRRECQKEGSELVSIETQEEQVYITKHAKNKNIRVWIGLFKDKGTKWSWLGGSAVGSEYWPSGQPSRKPKHDCCAITPQTHRYSWHALLCDTKIQSCCKKEPDDKWL